MPDATLHIWIDENLSSTIVDTLSNTDGSHQLYSALKYTKCCAQKRKNSVAQTIIMMSEYKNSVNCCANNNGDTTKRRREEEEKEEHEKEDEKKIAQVDSSPSLSPPPPKEDDVIDANVLDLDAIKTINIFADPNGENKFDNCATMHVFIILDALQVRLFLPTTRRKTNSNANSNNNTNVNVDEGESVFHSYINHICASVQENEGTLFCPNKKDDDSNKTSSRNYKLHILVAPNATANCSSSHINTNMTNANITKKEAAHLFAEAVAWRFDASSHAYRDAFYFGLCSTAATTDQLNKTVVALANKYVKILHEKGVQLHKQLIGNNTNNVTNNNNNNNNNNKENVTKEFLQTLSFSTNNNNRHMKTNTNSNNNSTKACFLDLYKQMLGEIHGFSERKVLTTLQAFPTMSHLLSYIEENKLDQRYAEQQQQQQQQQQNGHNSNNKNNKILGSVYVAEVNENSSGCAESKGGEMKKRNVCDENMMDALTRNYFAEDE